MMPVHQPTMRLFALLCAVAVVTGCPGPSEPEVPPTPVKPTGTSTKKPSAKPTGSANPTSPKPTGSNSPITPTATPTGGATGTPNPNATATPVGATPSPTPSATATPVGATPSPTPTATPVGATPSPTPTPTPTATATAVASATPIPTPTPTPAATATPGGPGRENGGTATTLAGDFENQGALDGTGTAATFSLPSAVAVDRNGFVWVADTGNSLIRKISSAGVVTFVAGSTQDFADGNGMAAKFNTPSGITVDDAGNVYVADTGNNRIRKIAAGTGNVTTLVGAGVGGQTLSFPSAVACDRSGNLYIADSGNFRILRVANGGTTASVFAGGAAGIQDGTGAAAQFISPGSLTVDGSGNVFVGDASNIRKITTGGVVTSLSVEDGAFSQPRITIDRNSDGSLMYATDADNNKIYTIKRDAGGTYTATLLAGAGAGYADATGAGARFRNPAQPFVTGDGTLYVPDQQNNCIRKLQ